MGRTMRMAEWMQTSGVTFGTSGARGLVSAMTDEVCFGYTRAFLDHLQAQGMFATHGRVAIAGDLRPSTTRMLDAVRAAVEHGAAQAVVCGRIPTPALALHGLEQGIPSVMVTGSHIPDDRNGIKFNRPDGEILKTDEAAIAQRTVELPHWFDAHGMLQAAHCPAPLPPSHLAAERYVERYCGAFAAGALTGRRVGVYGHSSVGRELLVEILTALGADVLRLGWSERFIPVDTEAIRAEDVRLARGWAREAQLFAIVSADGDADRPLIADAQGRWLRGDIAALLAARFVAADTVVCPVSCNTAVEACGAFARVARTRIGSPYVIEAMQRALADGGRRVVGYEANGGFLSVTPLALAAGGTLSPLPTRDAVVVCLAVLVDAAQRDISIAQLRATLPDRFTASDRLAGMAPERSRRLIDELTGGGAPAIQVMLPMLGTVRDVNVVDGLRVTFAGGEIVHWRPSGNAPELRCYAEAATEARAEALCRIALEGLATRG